MEKFENQTSSTRQLFVQYTFLAVLSMLGQSLFIFADTFFIANGVGAHGIAALNIVLPMISLFNGLGWLFGIGGATLFGIALGKKRVVEANQLFNMTLWFTLLASVIFVGVTTIFSNPLLNLLGANPEIYEMSASYYNILMLFAPLFMVNVVLVSFLRNDHNPRLAMIALLAGGLTNIILDYIFIFPLQMGLTGAAIATASSPIVSMLVASLHWRRQDHHLQFRKVSLKFEQLKAIASLGFSSFFNEFSSAVVMFLFNIMILQVAGTIGVAAYGIIANLNIIVIGLFTGIGQGFQPLISYYFGQRKAKEIKQVLKLALMTAVSLSIVIFLIGTLMPDSLVSIFNSDSNVQLATIASQGIPLYFASFLLTGVNFVVIYFLAAINQARASLRLSALRGIVFIIPVLLVMSLWFELVGIWLTLLVVETMTCVLAVYLLKKSVERLN
ncbi:MATE family efflux transporter [Fundicoccus sp. Sow4_D5]|uniref:MATE family efflux transporter n=1 Tax=unclassified Fundicoccus TaxID=2761543 RepID=UPI003F8DC660